MIKLTGIDTGNPVFVRPSTIATVTRIDGYSVGGTQGSPRHDVPAKTRVSLVSGEVLHVVELPEDIVDQVFEQMPRVTWGMD